MKVSTRFESGALLRVLSNVNGFVPAKSLYPVVRIELVPMFRATAADLWTVGIDEIEAIEHYGLPFEMVISAEHSKELESFVRKAKKADIELEVIFDEDFGGHFLYAKDTGTGLESELWPENFANGDPMKWARFFALVDAVMEPLERRSEEELRIPDAIAFQPSRLNAFAKVRDGAAANTVLDMRIYDVDSPVHLKVGESFRGAIMPIRREAAGQHALWGEDE